MPLDATLDALVDDATRRMVQYWDILCRGLFTTELPIRVIAAPGNTSTISHTDSGQVALTLLLQNGRHAPTELISHEIGHRCVELDGFIAATPTSVDTEEQRQVVQQVVSLAQHVPLYSLQRRVGHGETGLQAMVDSRARETLLVYSRLGQPPAGDATLLYGLTIVDDLRHCSADVRTQTETEILAVHKETRETVERIRSVFDPYDLLDQTQNYQATLAAGATFYPALSWGPSPLAHHIRALLGRGTP